MGRHTKNFITLNIIYPKTLLKTLNYDFTARLEDALDAVSRGEGDWLPLMREFWDQFNQLVGDTAENVSRHEVVQSRELGYDPKSGKLVMVRMGRFGPFAQIGGKEDIDKPRFASLRLDQRIDTVTLDDALVLFRLPRDLGITDGGKLIQANVGRFGPYIRYGNDYISLKGEDPYTVSRERALELIFTHQKELASKVLCTFPNSKTKILNGKFGPYITDGKKNIRLPKDREPTSLTLAECESMLSTASEKKSYVRHTSKYSADKPCPTKAADTKTSA